MTRIQGVMKIYNLLDAYTKFFLNMERKFFKANMNTKRNDNNEFGISVGRSIFSKDFLHLIYHCQSYLSLNLYHVPVQKLF